MASIFSLTSPSSLLTNHSSNFKGNVRNLNSSICHFPSIPNYKNNNNRVQKSLIVAASAPISSAAVSYSVRFRLDNLGPQPGSRKKQKRKGKGHAAGQGGSCGFGMRGQKLKSGPVFVGVLRVDLPLYRRLPKLSGIAGGNKNHIFKLIFTSNFMHTNCLFKCLFPVIGELDTVSCLGINISIVITFLEYVLAKLWFMVTHITILIPLNEGMYACWTIEICSGELERHRNCWIRRGGRGFT